MAEERVEGIDVSHYQGEIDWQTVAGADVRFAFIKSTDGTGAADPLFFQNWVRASEAGLRRGAYHFFRAQQDPERQAQRLIAMLEGDYGELPPVLDFEVLGDTSVEKALDGAKRWIDIVEKACGHKPILYTGPAFWTSTLKGSGLFATYPLWIAHYTKAANPTVPSAWKNWTFWQYSEGGVVGGVRGPVDLDYFVGNISELDVFCERIHKKSAAIGS